MINAIVTIGIFLFISHAPLCCYAYSLDVTPKLSQHVQYPTKSYTKELKGASNQIWDMDKDENGVLYFASTSGLLTNTYGYWEEHRPDSIDNLFLKSLTVVNDTVWCAGTNYFVQMIRDENGQFDYHFELDYPYGNYWHITKMPKAVFLHTEHILIRYDRKEKTYSQLSHPHRIYLIFEDREDLYAMNAKGDLLLYNNGKLERVTTIQELEGKELRKAITQNNLLYVFALDGTTVCYNRKTKDVQTIETDHLTPEIFTAEAVSKDRFVLGSITKGAIVTNATGRNAKTFALDNKIDYKSGIDDNTIMTSLIDQNNQLWLGLNYGVAYSEINSPFRILFNKASISSSTFYNGKLYLGTNKGVYFFNPETGDYQLISKTNGQVWGLKIFNNKLLVCHNRGVYAIDQSNSVRKLWKFQGAFTGKVIENGYFLLSTYSKLIIFKIEDGKKSNELEIWDNPVSRIVADPEYMGGYYAIGDENQLLYLRIENGKLTYKKQFTAENIFELNNRSYIYKNNQLYYPHIINDSLVLKRPTEAPFNNIQAEGISSMKSTEDGEHIIVNQKGNLVLHSQLLNGQYKEFPNLLGNLNGTLNTYGDGFSINDNQLFLYSAKSLITYDLKYREQRSLSKPIVYSVQSQDEDGKKTSLFYPSKHLEGKSVHFPSIQIKYSVNHLLQDEVKYAYQLLPNDEKYCEWSEEKSINYTNLRDGTYTLLIKARINGEETEEVQLNFQVDGAWYEKPWGKALEFLLLTFIIGLIWYIRSRIISRRKEELIQKQHQMELLSMKNEQATKFLARLEQKNAFMEKISDSLKRMHNERARQLVNMIKEESAKESNDFLYYTFFADNHKQFISVMNGTFPQLTQNDLRLCLFIKMNLTSKDIASLMHISTAGVEKARYRLRKKLDLSSDTDLASFLTKIEEEKVMS